MYNERNRTLICLEQRGKRRKTSSHPLRMAYKEVSASNSHWLFPNSHRLYLLQGWALTVRVRVRVTWSLVFIEEYERDKLGALFKIMYDLFNFFCNIQRLRFIKRSELNVCYQSAPRAWTKWPKDRKQRKIEDTRAVTIITHNTNVTHIEAKNICPGHPRAWGVELQLE